MGMGFFSQSYVKDEAKNRDVVLFFVAFLVQQILGKKFVDVPNF